MCFSISSAHLHCGLGSLAVSPTYPLLLDILGDYSCCGFGGVVTLLRRILSLISRLCGTNLDRWWKQNLGGRNECKSRGAKHVTGCRLSLGTPPSLNIWGCSEDLTANSIGMHTRALQHRIYKLTTLPSLLTQVNHRAHCSRYSASLHYSLLAVGKRKAHWHRKDQPDSSASPYLPSSSLSVKEYLIS